jgi:hypothetical protein
VRDGETIGRIQITTTIARRVQLTPKTLSALAYVNRFASLSALVLDGESLALRASLYVSERSEPGAERLAVAAMATQLVQTITQGRQLAELMGGTFDATEQKVPSNAPPSPVLVNALALFAGENEDRSAFGTFEFVRLTKADPHPWVMANADAGGFTAELPFTGDTPAALSAIGPVTALLEGSDERHPQLGNGLQLRLTFPLEATPDVAQRLNRAESEEWTGFHQLGAWCSGPEGLTFVTFLPAKVYMFNLLEVLVWHMAARARWATGRAVAG